MSKPRILSATNIYHVIMKGIDRNDVFLDDADRQAFISRLERFAGKLDCSVETYCLMSNHIHLLICTKGNYPPGELVKRLCTSYVQHYFNIIHDHEGSLFQGKFFSRPITDDNDFLCVARYIINNPLNGGLTKNPSYRFSSFGETVRNYDEGKNTGFVDTSRILGMIADKMRFYKFIEAADKKIFPEEAFKIKDAEIRKFLAENLNILPGSDPISLKRTITAEPASSRIVLSAVLKRGISVARLSRITGITRDKINAIILYR